MNLKSIGHTKLNIPFLLTFPFSSSLLADLQLDLVGRSNEYLLYLVFQLRACVPCFISIKVKNKIIKYQYCN